MLPDHRDGLSSSSFLAWSSIAQSVCQRACSLLANWCLGSRLQILLSAEEHILSPFDLNIACLCQSIEINNNKHVYRQSQVRKATDSGAKWAECSLIIGTGCRVQVFVAWSSIAQSVCQRACSLLANWCLGSRVQILLSAEEHNLSHNGKIQPRKNAIKNQQCTLDIWTIYGFCGTTVKLSSKPSLIS